MASPSAALLCPALTLIVVPCVFPLCIRRLAARSEGSSIDVFLVHAAEHIDVSATDNLQRCPSKDNASALECIQAPTLDANAPHARAQPLPFQQQLQQSQQQRMQQLQQLQRPRQDEKRLLSSAHAPQVEPSRAGPVAVQLAGPLQAHVTQYTQ